MVIDDRWPEFGSTIRKRTRGRYFSSRGLELGGEFCGSADEGVGLCIGLDWYGIPYRNGHTTYYTVKYGMRKYDTVSYRFFQYTAFSVYQNMKTVTLLTFAGYRKSNLFDYIKY